MAELLNRIFILFTQEEVDKIKKGLPVSLYDEETGKQTVFMTEEGYKEMNDKRKEMEVAKNGTD